MSIDRITFIKHGKQFNPALIPKPSLCTRCIKDGQEKSINLCTMNRVDQAGKKYFQCYAFEPKEDSQ